MQDIIKKIIEIDKKAQKMTEDALAEKNKAEKSIENDKKALREKYLTRARHRIDLTAQTEEKFLQESLQDISKKYENAGVKLQGIYNDQHEKWVSEIYTRVIGGDY